MTTNRKERTMTEKKTCLGKVLVLPQTYEYLSVRIAQKRTHIAREQKRLKVLLSLRDEVEAASRKAARNG